MTDRLRIALAQLNPVMGDIAGNLARARQAHGEAAKQGADLVLFSELFITDRLRIALAQLNPVMGDIAGNLARARQAHGEAAKQGADLVLFSELFITGYPPEDLVLKPALQADARAAVEALVGDTANAP